MYDIITMAAADVRPLRNGAPSVHPLDASPNAIHLGALHDGRLVGVLSAFPVDRDGEVTSRARQLWGPFGEGAEALVEALTHHCSGPCTVWADSARPGLSEGSTGWSLEIPAPPLDEPRAYTARSIQILDGVHAVRRRPAMYLGSTDGRGVAELIFELVNNSLDEHLAGHATHIDVHTGQDGTITVSDDGRGIPPELLATVLCEMHYTATYDGHHPHAHVSHLGIGLVAVNALAAWCAVESARDGKRTQALFSRGRLLHGPTELGPTGARGTTVRFRPDPKVFGDAQPEVRETLARTAYLESGLRITLNGEDLSQPGGLEAWLRDQVAREGQTPASHPAEHHQAPFRNGCIRMARLRGVPGPTSLFVDLAPVTSGTTFDAIATASDTVIFDVRAPGLDTYSRTRSSVSNDALTAALVSLLAL